MTIDTNCHLGHWPFRRIEHADADGLLGLLDRHAVQQAWVGAFEGLFYRDCGQANRELRARVSGHEDRLVPWATINPNFPAWEDDLREARESGMAGVRLYPNYHGYALDAPCLRELLAALAGELPVALYHKFVDERLHHWTCLVPSVEMTLEPLVAAFPDQRFLLCGCTMPHAQALADTIRQGRICMDISRVEGIEGVRLLIETIGLDHIVLGSHAPYFTMGAAHLKLAASGLSDEEREAVGTVNPQALLA
jgi:predicted TIM-barrel fold metal-dependent hydrolase